MAPCNASKCAATYLAAILAHGDRPYDEDFMRATFGVFWDYVQYPTTWTNATCSSRRRRDASGCSARPGSISRSPTRSRQRLNDPHDFFGWFMDPGKAAAYMDEVAVGPP